MLRRKSHSNIHSTCRMPWDFSQSMFCKMLLAQEDSSPPPHPWPYQDSPWNIGDLSNPKASYFILIIPVGILEALTSSAIEKPISLWTRCLSRKPFHTELVRLGTCFGKSCPRDSFPCSWCYALAICHTFPFPLLAPVPDFPVIILILTAFVTLTLKWWTETSTCS